MEIKRYLFTNDKGESDGEILAPSEIAARFIAAARWSDPCTMFYKVAEDGFGAYFVYEGTEQEYLAEVDNFKAIPIRIDELYWPAMLRKNPKVTDFIDSDALAEMAPLSARREVEDEEAEAARAPKDQYELNGVSRRDFC